MSGSTGLLLHRPLGALRNLSTPLPGQYADNLVAEVRVLLPPIIGIIPRDHTAVSRPPRSKNVGGTLLPSLTPTSFLLFSQIVSWKGI